MFCSTALLRRIGGFAAEQFRIGADTELMRRLYIAKVPFEAVQQISAHFYAGGVSYSPAVRTEVFDLMMHFTDAYCEEARNTPGTAVITLKHLRRYTTRMILQQAESCSLTEKHKELLTSFAKKLANALSPAARRLIRLHQKLLVFWYALNSRISSGKSRQTHMLHAEISRIFIEWLKGI